MTGARTDRWCRTRWIAPILCVGLTWLLSGCGSERPAPPDAATGGGSGFGTTSGATGATTSSGGAGGTGSPTSNTGSGVGGSTGGTGQSSTTGSVGTSGSGGASTSGAVGGSGGMATGGGGTGSIEACTFECVEQCTLRGGTEQPGTCDGEGQCCDGASAPANPLAHLIPSAEETGLLLANRFSQQNISYTSVANLPGDGYKTACEWYGALGVASLTTSQGLLDALVGKFAPFEADFVAAMTNGEPHVDRYIFGMVPLEIYLRTGDDRYLSMGTETADNQQVTNQTRNAIDDMFMMTGLQLQAYRATGDEAYIDFMSDTMVDYLGAQQDNGLFFHNLTEAPIHWGRGNGWFAAGMAEMMRDLPTTHGNYQAILDGYLNMMEGLLAYQSDNGLWYQVLNMPNDSSNWEETSGSAMFTYAMVAGVRRGVLDQATYVPVIEAAWQGLQAKISAQGAVSDICEGTWYHPTAQDYMALRRLTGDGHGQAPVLWVAAELLR